MAMFNEKGEDCKPGDSIMMAIAEVDFESRAFAHIYRQARAAGFGHETAIRDASSRAIDPR
jgi:hypothetical protein